MVNRIKHHQIFTFYILLFVLNTSAALAQTTAFTYQGKLSDSGNAATGNFDFQVKLFDALTGGAQQGATLNLTNVTVSGGVFTVQLDFGACASCFTGAARFLEISVKPTSGSTFTTLSPRQQLTANPYAIKSLSAVTADGLSVTCVSCVTGNQIQSVNGSAVSGTIPVASVPAGSANYIQNTTTQQSASNFNISGNGTVSGDIRWGRSLLSSDQGGSIELGSDNATVGIGSPYIDFHSIGSPQDYNVRLINDANGRLSLNGKLHVVGQDVRVQSTSGTTNLPHFSLHYTSAATNTGKWLNYAADNRLIFSAIDDNEVSESVWLRVNRLIGTIAINSIEFPTSLVRINNLAGGGSATVCRDPINQLASCGSSIRYKKNVKDYQLGLALIKKLRPVSFNWKADNQEDFGLVAEEVNTVEPLLTTKNEKGEIEGVKYDRIGVVLVNAVKEQQAQIERQQSEIERQQKEIESLKKVICSSYPKASVCNCEKK